MQSYHEDNRVSVLFSTNELFSKFVTNLSQELVEHKIAQKCFINIHKEENSRAVEGPGCRIWRETTLLRLATNFYRQYESDTNTYIEGTKQQTTSSNKCGSRGVRPPPPGKSQVIWVSIGNKLRTKKNRCQSFFCQTDLDPPPDENSWIRA